MSFIHPSLFYIHLKTFAKIIYLQCFKHFSIKRFLITILFLVLFVFISTINLFFRIADEILFPNYRKIDIKNPVFIISNPRSGTTFLHRLMCMDEQKYVYTLLFHTLFPSITIFKIIDFVALIDSKIGQPLRTFFDWLDDICFKGWEDIHPMGFNKSEEDEGTYIFTGLTAGIFLLCPYMNEIDYVRFPDKMDKKARDAQKSFYKNCMQRWMYAMGSDKMFLSKNVMSTGRLQLLLENFPDAKIIYLVRTPYEAVPSFISMFSLAWKSHSPEIPENSIQHRAWGELGIEYYQYFTEQKKNFKPENWFTLKYTDLVENPKQKVMEIYNHFGFEISPAFDKKLENASNRAKKYESKHGYTLEQYGMTKAEIYNKIPFIFEEFGFEK